MNTRGLIHQRLINQQIIQTSFTDPRQLVSWFGAMQAQEYAMAKWAIGLRMPGVHETDIEKAFNKGEILRTHVLRPTWHFVTPEDIKWLLALTGPRINAFNAPYYKRHEVDAKLFNKSKDVLVKNLRDEKFMDREAIHKAFAKAKINASGIRFAFLLMHAELDGIICSGPRQGKQFTYALLDVRAPRAKILDRDEALNKIVVRYFTSRAPATLNDFAWWSGLTVKDGRDGAATLPSNFIHENINGKDYIINEAVPVLPFSKQQRARTTFLMPNYDEFAICYKDRSAIMGERGRGIVFERPFIIDGKVFGSWKPVLKNKMAEVETSFFVSLNKSQQQAANKAVKRYKSYITPPSSL